MKSLNDCLQQYRNIAINLGLYGDTVELLSQFLANASFINEVENITYSQEATLDRCIKLNSKIEHCVDRMYSVYRGSCPRIILKFYSQSYNNMQPFDKIYSGNNWNLYYLGYFDEKINDFSYTSKVISPLGDQQEYTIMCILSPGPKIRSWEITDQIYLENTDSNLSNDVYITSTFGDQKIERQVTRDFSDYILSENDENPLIFDLTIPGYGSRLYSDNFGEIGTIIIANYFTFCSTNDFNLKDLTKICINGTTPVSFSSEDFLIPKGYVEMEKGIVIVPETPPDDIKSLHYRANKHRFDNSIIRSNNDIGFLLSEMYPNKVSLKGASYIFDAPEPSKEVIETTTQQFIIPEGNQSIMSSTKTLLDKNQNLYYICNNSNDMGLITYDEPLTLSTGSSYSQSIYLGNGKFTNKGPQSGVLIIDVPYSQTDTSGELQIVYKSKALSGEIPSIYTILPSMSRFDSTTSIIQISVMKSSSQTSTKIIETVSQLNEEGLTLKCVNKNKDSNGNINYIETQIDGEYLVLDQLNNNNPPIQIEIQLLKGDSLISREIISRIDESNKTVLDLTKDTVFLESNALGELEQKLPITLTTAYYYIYNKDKGVTTVTPTYQTVSLGKATYEVNNSGEVILTSISNDVDSIDIPVIATYNGNTLVKVLSLKKSIAVYGNELLSRDFYIGDDLTGATWLQSYKATTELQVAKLHYDGGKSSLYIWAPNDPIEILDLSWTYNSITITNLIDNQIEVPSLRIYYVPIQSAGYLTNNEINNFIKKRSSYFVSSNVTIQPANHFKAIYRIGLQLYSSDSLVSSKVGQIFSKYEDQLNIDLNNKIEEIKTSLSKINNVSSITDFSVQYFNENEDEVSWEEISNRINISYFTIQRIINTTLV